MKEEYFNKTVGVVMASLLPQNEKRELIDSIRAMEKETKNNGWIPCSERLPEDGTRVIACFKHGLVTELKYKSAGIFEGINEYVAEVIDAWMPLPEPYREEQEDGR
ncbi:DUF551 domain-containing protein [Eubacterium sp. AF15-50]|uniref:DUF551 domain-containing protein n=1 Tax=unclassified Eubacterium (in: firmicutes) TaxID=2624479 RepID=UPI000E4976FB|nr:MULTISPECIES: DUF551 domain-containing protein [unclassified Eubacterium (in: firmicutes)]RHR72609.1 DUF551 domain-containing protein [Eubacterium sp. AF16-48]RHR75681.1 DUF551 domain-containing protein [Eubacterium sp. AF15-50]